MSWTGYLIYPVFSRANVQKFNWFKDWPGVSLSIFYEVNHRTHRFDDELCQKRCRHVNPTWLLAALGPVIISLGAEVTRRHCSILAENWLKNIFRAFYPCYCKKYVNKYVKNQTKNSIKSVKITFWKICQKIFF